MGWVGDGGGDVVEEGMKREWNIYVHKLTMR